MKLDKIEKQLSKEVMNEISALPVEKLNQLVVAAEQAIAQTTQERDANPAYQGAKQAVKDLGEALKEVKKYQNAKIQYALILLQELA